MSRGKTKRGRGPTTLDSEVAHGPCFLFADAGEPVVLICIDEDLGHNASLSPESSSKNVPAVPIRRPINSYGYTAPRLTDARTFCS